MKNFKFYTRPDKMLFFILIFSFIAAFFLAYSVPADAAANVIVSTEGLPNGSYYDYPLKSSSDAKAVIRLQVWTDQPSAALATTTVQFNTTNFAMTDLASLSTGAGSGVAIYRDNGSTAYYFDGTDSIVILTQIASTTAIGATTSIIFFGNGFSTPPSLTQNATTTFFIVIRTSSSPVNYHRIIATIPINGVYTSPSGAGPAAPFTANSYLIDTVSPGIVGVYYNTNNSVTVIFNEKIGSGATYSGNYSFLGTAAIAATMMNDYSVKVDSAYTVTIGTTYLTANASIYDWAGNPNASTSLVYVTETIQRIVFSEISADYIDDGANDTEFIELYNPGDTAVNMNNWYIQHSTALCSNCWTYVGEITTACTNASTTINSHAYYLLGGPGLNNVISASTSKDCNFSNYNINLFTLSGGHLRLMSSTGQEIDRFGWGTAVSPEGSSTPAHAPVQSWERKAYGNSTQASMALGGLDELMGNGYDSNSNNFDFVVQSNAHPQCASSITESTSGGGGGGGVGLGIYHTPVNSAPIGAALHIFAQMGDPALPLDQINTELHYMVGDGTPYNNSTSSYATIYGQHQGNGYFMFTIPSASTTAAGIYYYLKLTSGSSVKLMSASPTADYTNNESSVALNPFQIACANPPTTYTVSGYATLSGLSDHSNILVFAAGTGYYATTTSGGFFSFSVKPGTYNFVFIKSGYYEGWFNGWYINAATNLGTKILYPGTGGGASGDSVLPTVKWTGPNDGSTGMPYGDPNFKIMVSFSKDIASSTFNAANVVVTTGSSTPISGYSVAYNPARDAYMPSTSGDPYLGIIYAPAATGFASGTTYNIILSNNIRDWAGNSLSGNRTEGGHVFSITTQGSAGTYTYGAGSQQPPYVMDIKPSSGNTNIPLNTKIAINFSETMDYGSITAAGNIKLYRVDISGFAEATTSIAFTANLDVTGKIALITPTGNLLANNKYRVIVTGAVKSSSGNYAGNSLTGQNVNTFEFYRSSFETGASTDLSAPTVLGSWPTNAATNIAVNPGSFNFQMSESLDPSTVNANTVSFKYGNTMITNEVKFDTMANSIYIMPKTALSAETNYTLTLTGSSTGIKDLAGNALAPDVIIGFTTGSSYDTGFPKIMYANADDYKLAITFSEPMNSANVTDTNNWPKSVLNAANYAIKWGNPSDVATAGTALNLAYTNFYYDGFTNTAFLENLGLDHSLTDGKDLYINMSAGNAVDLSGNNIASNTASSTKIFQTPIQDSSVTYGQLGPSTGGGGMYDMGNMGMMKAGAWPKNSLAGQTTSYFIDIPTFRSIPIGGKIMITFPIGFDVGSARKDAASPVNNDINGGNIGGVRFDSATEAPLSGGANNDGVTVDAAARSIMVKTASSTTQASDYLHFDLTGIVNSTIPRNYDTAGYTADIKTMDNNGVLLESITTMPFFISAAGAASLTVNLAGILDADVDGTNDDVRIYLGSPMTGPLENEIAVANNGTGNTIFSGLPVGNYYIYTDPTILFTDGAGSRYNGIFSTEPIYISGAASKTVTFTKEAAGAGKATITINISGNFGSEYADVYASGPNNYKLLTVTGNNPSATFYLGDGSWSIGVVPSVPTGQMAGPAQMPLWMPPMPVSLNISAGGTSVSEQSGTVNDGTVAFTIQSANKEIIGYVKDGTASSTPIADAEVWAYQPGGTGGMGGHARTDTAGKFILKVYQTGSYKIGASKPGLPSAPERAVTVAANVDNTDGNTTADIYGDTGTIITGANQFVIKIKKPGYTISGKITDGVNPVANMPVWANQSNGYGYANTMSDNTGNFILYVDNGTWNLSGYVPNYGNAETKTVIVSGADVSQNLAPNSSQVNYTISGLVGFDANGTYSNVETPFAYQPIRAVAYNAQGVYQGREYNTITDSNGSYRLTVPAGIYRVDIWTQQYGEIGINNQDQDNTLNEATDDDKYANNPANVNATAGNVNNADIIIVASSLRTVTINFSNGSANQEGFLKIEGVSYQNGESNPPVPTGYNNFLRVANLSTSTAVRLAPGDYHFFLEVPGAGRFTPASSSLHSVKKDIVVATSTDRTVGFILPISGTDTVTVSGTITDGANPLPNVWVWVNNPAAGFHYGTMASASGTYALNIPIGNNYNIGADKPGYLGAASSSVDITAVLVKNFVLSAAGQTISGYIYTDGVGGTNNQMDSGEEIANGFVRAETTDGSKKSFAPVDGTGYFALPAVNGIWRVYGMADGYSETLYGSNVTVNNNNPTLNIELTANSNWTNRTKASSIIPANGGTIDDTATSGTLIKLTFPPNALGNSDSAGNVNANRTGAVGTTNSSEPIDNEGVNVNATDNNGQAITNLNDYIDIEMLLYKEDVAALIASGALTYAKLKNTTISFWDSSANDWVSLSTGRTAYYKDNAGDTEWTLYNNTATTTEGFSAFINEIACLAITPADYKLVFSAKSNHLTIFAVIMPFIAEAAEPAPETPPGPILTGGGGSYPSNCRIVEYGAWQAECVNGFEYRDVVSRTPASCTMSAEQIAGQKRACAETATSTPEAETSAPDSAADMPSASINELYLAQGEFIKRAEVSEILTALGLPGRNHLGEQLSRGTLINKLGIDLNKLEARAQYALTNFITYGSPDTVKLGWGERAGVLNSFRAAFGKVPTTAEDWSDIIKIANGRWPTQRSTTAENKSSESFKKIYKRAAVRRNAHNDAAVTVIAYGLRPAKRNMGSEAAAAKIFKAIYGYSAVGATDWDIVRAIAYSGAVR